MAGSYSSSEEIVKALGLGIKVLDSLSKGIVKHGGDPEILHRMTLERSKENLDEITRFIATRDWRTAASEMRSLAIEGCGFEVDKDDEEFVRNVLWFGACARMRIPYEGYDDDPENGSRPPIPSSCRRKLSGRKLEYPFFLDKEHVVVDIGFKNEGSVYPKLGDLIDANDISHISFTKRHYFNFDA